MRLQGRENAHPGHFQQDPSPTLAQLSIGPISKSLAFWETGIVSLGEEQAFPTYVSAEVQPLMSPPIFLLPLIKITNVP